MDLNTSNILSIVTGGVANSLIEGGTVVNYLIVNFRASCLSKIFLTFFLLSLLNLIDPVFLAVEPLFIGNLVKLSSLKINSVLSAPLLLVKLLTLTKLATLVKKLLFVYILTGLTLILLILEVGLIPIKDLAKLVILITAKPIFIDGLVLLALLNYLTELPFVEFSSFRLF